MSAEKEPRPSIPRFSDIFEAPPESVPGTVLGSSREGRPVVGHRFGAGETRISLIAGCHADEPVGPALLRRLVTYLASRPADHPAIAGTEWWIVSHANPDGEARNRSWSHPLGDSVDPVAYLRGVVREAPGDDVEYGFPRSRSDAGARPENRAVADWWSTTGGPFAVHASLHGMSVAEGPWFLVDGSWKGRVDDLMARCAGETTALGYRLHDVDRRGEKGFERLGPGFSTRPDSRPMARFFRERGEETTAALFRPTSMEAIRDLGGDPLTLVSEMPLFLLPPRAAPGPSTSEDLVAWKHRLDGWRRDLGRSGGAPGGPAGDLTATAASDTAVEADSEEIERIVRRQIAEAGIIPMPVADQMRLQWTLVSAGIERARRP